MPVTANTLHAFFGIGMASGRLQIKYAYPAGFLFDIFFAYTTLPNCILPVSFLDYGKEILLIIWSIAICCSLIPPKSTSERTPKKIHAGNAA